MAEPLYRCCLNLLAAVDMITFTYRCDLCCNLYRLHWMLSNYKNKQDCATHEQTNCQTSAPVEFHHCSLSFWKYPSIFQGADARCDAVTCGAGATETSAGAGAEAGGTYTI